MTAPAVPRSRGVATWEWLAIAAAVSVFAYVGWDSALWDARYQLGLHLMAVAAILGLAAYVARGGSIPRTPVDLPLLALLAAFAVATVSAANLGMSLRALAAIVATALMLPIALLAVRHRPTALGLVTSVPILALSIVTLAAMVERRIEWVAAGAPGLLPLRLSGEISSFGSIAIPPFVIWPAWALAGLIGPAELRRPIRIALALVGVSLTILSGSRAAWLAAAAAILVVGIPYAWRRRSWLRPPPGRAAAWAVGAVVALALGAAAVVLMLPRLTVITSLVYRGLLWRDTLAAWSSDPILGLGPGFMPYARQAAAPDFSFPVRQPHSHNLALGILGDAGVLGLLAALVVVVVLAAVAGPWRSQSATGRAAATVLVGLAASGLFEDLTFTPAFNLLAIGLVAMALVDAERVAWRPLARGRLRRAAIASAASLAAVPLLAGMIVSDAGAVAYREGIDAAAGGDWPLAAERFATAWEVDPWHPAGPKALAVAAYWAGDVPGSRDAAREAVSLNAGDAESWVNLSIACAALGDVECQREATERSVATAALSSDELLNAAFSYEALGDHAAADDAYRRSLLTQTLTSFATDWPRRFSLGDAGIEDDATAQVEINRLFASHAMGDPIEPRAFSDPTARAVAHAIVGERAEAERWLAEATSRRPDSPLSWLMAAVLRDHWGQPIERELAIARAVRGGRVPSRGATSRIASVEFDIGSFRAYPADGLVRPAVRVLTQPVYPWVVQRVLP